MQPTIIDGFVILIQWTILNLDILIPSIISSIALIIVVYKEFHKIPKIVASEILNYSYFETGGFYVHFILANHGSRTDTIKNIEIETDPKSTIKEIVVYARSSQDNPHNRTSMTIRLQLSEIEADILPNSSKNMRIEFISTWKTPSSSKVRVKVTLMISKKSTYTEWLQIPNYNKSI